MANNTYTLSDLTKAVVHSLGGTPDTNLNVNEIVNGALSWLCMMAPWRWRQKALSLNSVNGQNYIALPADFQEIDVIRKAGDTTGCVESVSLDRIIEARQSPGTMLTNGLWYCLDWTPQTSTTVEPTPILQIYPTPSATTSGYIVGIYLRQIPKLASVGDLPDIPSSWHELLKVMCRAYAVGTEEQQRGADWQQMLDMLPMYERLDGRSPGYLGRYRGALMAPRTSNLAAQTQAIGA